MTFRAVVSLVLQHSPSRCSLPVTLNSWVDESNVIFVVQVGTDLLRNLDESLQSKSVGKVRVKIVLVVLKLVHLLHGIVVVSHLGEREGLVIKLLSGHSKLGELTLFTEFILDVHGILPVLHLEVSGELSELIVQFLLRDFQWLWAFIELHKVVKLLLVIREAHGLGGGNDSTEKKSSVFHTLTENIYSPC